MDLTGRTHAAALAQLFGLSDRAQRSVELDKKVISLGVVNQVRLFSAMLAREDIVVALARSIATREHVKTPTTRAASFHTAIQELKDAEGVLGKVHDLVSEQDTRDFLENDEEGLMKLEEYVASCFRSVTGKLTKEDQKLLSSINKLAVKKALGMAESEGFRKTKAGSGEDYRQSNRSTLDPGYGYSPHVAVTATNVVFTPLALEEWASKEDSPAKADDPSRGERARTFANELTVLVVDRSIAENCAGDDTRTRLSFVNFESIVGAMDRHGLLFNVLRDNINALSITGGPFFDAARLAVMKEALGEVRDGGDKTAAAQEGEKAAGGPALHDTDGHSSYDTPSATLGVRAFVSYPRCDQHRLSSALYGHCD